MSNNFSALLGDDISFECRQKVYPTRLSKSKAKEKAMLKAKKIGIDPNKILVFDYWIKGIFCDSVNCVIEKATKLKD